VSVCVYSFCAVLCAGSSLAMADHPSKESYRLCKLIKKLKKATKVQQRAVEPLIDR
jgi:hypothetical protein